MMKGLNTQIKFRLKIKVGIHIFGGVSGELMEMIHNAHSSNLTAVSVSLQSKIDVYGAKNHMQQVAVVGKGEFTIKKDLVKVTDDGNVV